jgi:hypothetical protein
MENFTSRQIMLLVLGLVIAGILTAWGTVFVLERYVLQDPTDPLTKQGGLSPAQSIGKR